MDHLINLNVLNSVQLDKSKNGLFEKAWVHLIFCLEDNIIFQFSPFYSRTLDANKAYIIYDPDKDLPYQLERFEKSKLCMIKLSLGSLHNMFVPASDHAPIFKPENANKKCYEERDISHELIPVLYQLFDVKLKDNALRLYLHAKSIEILSLFFSTSKADFDACPFLNNDQVVRKIKNAKNLLIQNYTNPETLTNIAKQVGLNELQLKMGFKEIFGNTPYQFVLDYKLELARQMLSQKKLLVNEVADKVGYTNVSHFISAFKRKYGLTPKKFIS